MKIVIDIDDNLYTRLFDNGVDNYGDAEDMATAIRKGTPLPKGHGRIMDVDKIIKKMEEREEYLKDNRSMYETACVETALDMFGETIIEADKTESEDKYGKI